MRPIWFKNHVAYTMAKYGMSMCVLGMAEEFRDQVFVALGKKIATAKYNLCLRDEFLNDDTSEP